MESKESISHGNLLEENRHKAGLVAKRVAIVLVYVILGVAFAIAAVVYFILILPAKRARRQFSSQNKEDEPLTNDWWGLHSGDDDKTREALKPKQVDMRRGVELRTCYITMRDGVKLATDIWIPKKPLETKGRLPVIFHQARYYRSATLRWPFNVFVNGGKPISFINDPFFKSFLSHDMILVSVDVRGTGASFGTHPGPWSEEEQKDSYEVLDWINSQEWSNGKVGLWGLSYEGNSAFFTSLLRHPTVVCCCPMFFFWEVYDDLSHPGGVPMRHFSLNWQGFNDSLDSGWVQSTGWMARIFLEGVSPVGTVDPWGFQITKAVAEHRDNWSILKDDHILYMDDTSNYTGREVGSACASYALHRLLTREGYTTEGKSEESKNRIGVEAVREEEASTNSQDTYVDVLKDHPVAITGTDDISATRQEEGTLDSDVSSGEERDEVEMVMPGQAQEEGDVSRHTPEGLHRSTAPASLEKCLPFYLHVSGWLDASANAAIMAFMSIPCSLLRRSKYCS